MDIELGRAPQGLRVRVAAGADFVAGLHRKDGTPWPATAVAELRFTDGPTWATTRDGAYLWFDIDTAIVDAVATDRRRVSLWYVEAGEDTLWARGQVARRA